MRILLSELWGGHGNIPIGKDSGVLLIEACCNCTSTLLGRSTGSKMVSSGKKYNRMHIHQKSKNDCGNSAELWPTSCRASDMWCGYFEIRTSACAQYTSKEVTTLYFPTFCHQFWTGQLTKTTTTITVETIIILLYRVDWMKDAPENGRCCVCNYNLNSRRNSLITTNHDPFFDCWSTCVLAWKWCVM